jgi:hypothetical protein
MMTDPNKHRNVRTRAFKDSYEALPEHLRRHLRRASVSVSISMTYRAIDFVDDSTNVWYWIGSHADYNTLVGRK